MSTDAPTIDDAAAEHGAHDDEYDAHTDHKPDSYYISIALALAVITGLEVALSYIDFGSVDWLFLPLLLGLMLIKFFTVVSIFMHLKFDNRIFKWCFYSGLGLAVGVYVAALATFHFFV